MDLNCLLSSSMVPAQERIMSHLGSPDFATLSRLSNPINATLKDDALPSCYTNIDSKLLAFFKDPKSFRSLQVRTGAMIGDDFARKFVGNQLHHPVDRLHIYVERSVNGAVERFALIKAYLEPYGWIVADESTNKRFERSGAGDDGIRIQVYVSWYSPLDLLLFQAASTATLNFIAWNIAYSMFPQMIFTENECYVLQKFKTPSKPADAGKRECAAEIRNISKDGILTKLMHWDDETENSITRVRRICDKSTMVVGLDVSDIDSSTVATPNIYIESSTFRVLPFEGTEAERGLLERYELGCTTFFNHTIFKHSWVSFIEPERWTYEQSNLWKEHETDVKEGKREGGERQQVQEICNFG